MSCYGVAPFDSAYAANNITCGGQTSSLEDLISRAGEIFDLPYQYLACMFFLESKWDTDAHSHRNAYGVTQIRGDALEEINHILASKDRSENIARRFANLNEQSQDTPKYWNDYGMLDSESRKNSAFRKAKIAWIEFFESLGYVRYENRLAHPTNPIVPHQMTKEMLGNPAYSIASAAFFLSFITTNYPDLGYFNWGMYPEQTV